MITFDAFHLPGVDVDSIRAWDYLEHNGVRSRYPLLTASQISELCKAIRMRRNQQLIELPVAEIVAAIDQAAAKLQEESTTTAELLSAITGYSMPVVTQTLDHMFSDWHADALHTMLAAELPDARILDEPVEDPDVPGKRIAVYGFPLTFHVFSGNVPGVAVTSIVRALLVKSAVLGKTASGEPALSVLFARALAQVAPHVAACLAVTYWPGGTHELEAAALREADAVVVYGGSHAVQRIRQAVPAGMPLVVHGPRVSFGVVGPEHDRSTARAAAAAVAAYDQQGCVSPHLVFVVGDASDARQFASHTAQELAGISVTHPRGRLKAEEAVAIRNARTAAEFGNCEVYGEDDSGFSVIFEPNPSFRLSCLNRVLYVMPVTSLHDVANQLPAPNYLQSAAVAGFDPPQKAELVRLLGLAGVSRVTSFEKLPWPPMHWHHDGSAPLRELLRWQDVEA